VYFADLTRTVLSSDYAFVEWLPGSRLVELIGDLTPDREAAVRYELGDLTARLHSVSGTHFGYPRRDGRTRSSSWRVSFAIMVDDVLAGAHRLRVDLGAAPDRIATAVRRHERLLDAVGRPTLVHFDLWDGNVLVGAEGTVFGLIDGERTFYGDPYAEFVSLALLRDIAEVPDLLDGYARRTGRPVRLDRPDRTRITLYTIYLYLLMLSEGPTRGYVGPGHEAFLDRLRGLLDRLLTTL
jgi:aminoglycoside phosphotransferase (APT) family kinase protein